MSDTLLPSLTERARSALANHAWREAFELLSSADTPGALSPQELELLAQASWWVGRLPAAIEARERAYAASVRAGDTEGAATTAILLANDNLVRSAHSVAAGWLNRAERLLDGMEEGPAHGLLAMTRALASSLAGNVDEALGHAARAYETAVRFGDRDLAALALSARGVALLSKGRVEEGMGMLDEAAVAAVGGELRPFTAGVVSCTTIGACATSGDWERAVEWSEAQDRWCRREQISGFPGMCRLHRAGIKRLRGSWLEAEAEARRATDELEGFIPFGVGAALYEIGVIRTRRGDLPAAEEALLRAHTYGRDPEPALSLVRLAQGRVEEAATSIRRALDEPASEPSWWAPPNSELARLGLLPAQVEIALAAGDVPTARRAAEELAGLAETFGTASVRAGAAVALGTVRVAEGDRAGGEQDLRRGIRLWGEIDAPYEVARARLALAGALAADGDASRASLELRTARAAFERLGALLDLRRADEAIGALEGGAEGSVLPAPQERVTRTFVFTDIVDSTRLTEALGDEAWNSLIRWHDRALRSLVAEHGGEEIKAIGDGLFLAFADADDAIAFAVAVQRRLEEHRRNQGFAPAVRIGMHRAEANRAGLDYLGSGVNQAARIGAQAGGGEILASAETIERARRAVPQTGGRTVQLKGISAPVEVVSVDWR